MAWVHKQNKQKNASKVLLHSAVTLFLFSVQYFFKSKNCNKVLNPRRHNCEAYALTTRDHHAGYLIVFILVMSPMQILLSNRDNGF